MSPYAKKETSSAHHNLLKDVEDVYDIQEISKADVTLINSSSEDHDVKVDLNKDTKDVSNHTSSDSTTQDNKIQDNIDTKSLGSKRKRKNLAVRLDVMNKNFFRGIKRNLKSIYKAFLKAEDLKDSTCNVDYNMERFLKHLKEIYGNTLSSSVNFNGENIKSYIKVLVKYCQMKNNVNGLLEKEILDKNYEVLYCYSHKKFYEYVALPEISTLIEVVLSHFGHEKFISSITN